MRYGLIVAPTTSPDLRPSPGTFDSDLVRARLPQDDVAIHVVELNPTSDVAEQIELFFDGQQEAPEAVLFYASTLVALSGSGEVFLCLDPTNPDVGDGLRDIAGAIRDRFNGPLLFVLDCRHAADEEDAFRSATVVAAVRAALDPNATGIELLVAAQPVHEELEDAASPFTRAFLGELDETDPSRRLLAADVYRRIHGSERLLGVVPSFAFVRGREPFVMIAGDGSGRAASMVDRAEAGEGSFDGGLSGATPAVILSDGAASSDGNSDDATEQRLDSVEAKERAYNDAEAKAQPLGPSASYEAAAGDAVSFVVPPAPRPPSFADASSFAVAPEDVGEPQDGAPQESANAAASGASAPPIPSLPQVPRAPQIPSAPPNEPPHNLAPPKSTTSISSPSMRAVSTTAVLISDRPPPPDPGALPKIVISERPPPKPASVAPPAATTASPSADAAPPAPAAPEEPAATPAPAATDEPIEPAPKEPTFESHVAAGDALASRDAESALAEYKKALLLVTPAQKEERADVYVRVGQVKLLQDKRREAISNFEKATQLSPNHQGALEEIAKLSVEERDWRSVAATEEKILAAIHNPEVRFTRLMEFGNRWESVAFDAERAHSAFQRAREIQPSDLDLLGKLEKIYEASGKTAEAFALRLEIATKTTDDRMRAERYAALGQECLEAKDEDQALGFFDQALDADPTALAPLATAASLLAERQEWSELESTYRRMLQRADRIPELQVRSRLRWELNRRLALLFRDHLEDPEMALRALEKAIGDQPDDSQTRQAAIALARDLGKWDLARKHLQVCSRLDPMVVQTYHDLFDVFQKLGRPDQAWCAASVTAQLGHADQRERFIYEENKVDGPPKPTRAIDADGWDLLRDSSRNHAVEDVLEAIVKAAIEAKLADLRAAGRLPALDPAAKQDPKKSTVSIVRSFNWASHFLGVPMPAVYLRDDAQVGLAAVIAEEPAVIAGAGVLRGKSLTELAFAAGRHLGYHFGSHRLLLYYPVIDDLAACFLAAVRIVMPNASVPARMEKAAATMQGRIEPLLSTSARAALERAVLAFDAAGSRADLNAWVASVERCSTRAGYLLAGDLRTAATSLAAEGPGVLSVEQKMVDLLWFTVSEELHALREELGIAVQP